MRYIGCPQCRVRYPVDRLHAHPHDRPADGRVYTVVCAVCGQQFDVSFRKRRFLPLRATVRPKG